MPPRAKIMPGQQFREQGRPYVWVVQAVFERPNEPSHVRLVLADDPYRLKTVGVAALLDQQLFEPVGSPDT